MRRSSALVSVFLVFACGGAPAPDPGQSVDEIDGRVALPATDPAYVDLVSPELVVPPGTEKMFCMHLEQQGGDLVIDGMETEQGKYGHHVVLLYTLDPKPAGTLEDCTDPSVMWKFRSFVLPDTPLPRATASGCRRGCSTCCRCTT